MLPVLLLGVLALLGTADAGYSASVATHTICVQWTTMYNRPGYVFELESWTPGVRNGMSLTTETRYKFVIDKFGFDKHRLILTREANSSKPMTPYFADGVSGHNPIFERLDQLTFEPSERGPSVLYFQNLVWTPRSVPAVAVEKAGNSPHQQHTTLLPLGQLRPAVDLYVEDPIHV